MVMESFKGNAPGNESFGRASVPSARLRAQTAILYYRVRNSPIPVGSGRHSSETGVISQQRLSTRRCKRLEANGAETIPLIENHFLDQDLFVGRRGLEFADKIGG